MAEANVEGNMEAIDQEEQEQETRERVHLKEIKEREGKKEKKVEEEVEKRLLEKLTTELVDNDLGDIANAIHSARSSWEAILTRLKVPIGDIKAYKKTRCNEPQPCLMDGLEFWLKGNTKKFKGAPAVNWQSILTELGNVTVGEARLATTIKDNFKKEIKTALEKEVLISHHSIDYQDPYFETLDN